MHKPTTSNKSWAKFEVNTGFPTNRHRLFYYLFTRYTNVTPVASSDFFVSIVVFYNAHSDRFSLACKILCSSVRLYTRCVHKLFSWINLRSKNTKTTFIFCTIIPSIVMNNDRRYNYLIVFQKKIHAMFSWRLLIPHNG